MRTALPRPDAILLNGGVFNSPALKRRLIEAVSAWWPDSPEIPLLEHLSLDRAVARGAAYYGLVRRGLGRRIGGGAARAYYVGLERTADAGNAPALCLIPRGFEEGQTVRLGERPFTLTLGRPVQFPLFSTTSDRIDPPGALVERGEDFRPLPPLLTVLKARDGQVREAKVTIEATLTEIGTLELSCVAADTDERWRLEFELRGTEAGGPIAVTESMPTRFTDAVEQVARVYGHKPMPLGPKDVKNLSRSLERVLGPREGWRVPVLRELWSALVSGASKRRRSADHERVFCSLVGYALRPGFGYPLDPWRCEQTARLFLGNFGAEAWNNALQFHTDKAVWIEFWVMWRRIAGGLTEDVQRQISQWAAPHLERRLSVELTKPGARPLPKLKGVQPEGLDEMVRAIASLEHLPPSEKERFGDLIASKLRAEAKSGGPWAWSLGRLGARVPIHGSTHRTVAPEVASRWLSLLLELGLDRVDGAPFAATLLARRTGDRTRDLEEDLREQTRGALAKAKAPAHWLQLVNEVVALDAEDEARALGDTLPAGLAL